MLGRVAAATSAVTMEEARAEAKVAALAWAAETWVASTGVGRLGVAAGEKVGVGGVEERVEMARAVEMGAVGASAKVEGPPVVETAAVQDVVMVVVTLEGAWVAVCVAAN